MITFNVSRETHGWAVRTDDGAMTPYWSRALAIARAEALAARLRSHGQAAMVSVAPEIGEDTVSFAPRRNGAAVRPAGMA